MAHFKIKPHISQKKDKSTNLTDPNDSWQNDFDGMGRNTWQAAQTHSHGASALSGSVYGESSSYRPPPHVSIAKPWEAQISKWADLLIFNLYMAPKKDQAISAKCLSTNADIYMYKHFVAPPWNKFCHVKNRNDFPLLIF